MAQLTPTPVMQFFDSNGDPLVGGKLYTYASGTTTPQVTYTSQTGATPNTNPVILDARGEANIWLGNSLYTFVLKTAADVLIWSADGVGGVATLAALAASGGAALIGYTQGGTGAVTRTVQARLRDIPTLGDFGAAGDGSTDDSQAILNCAAANGGYVVGQPGKIYRTSGQFTPPATFVFNLNGSTWKPLYSGTSYAVNKSVTLGTAWTVSSSSSGSRTITTSAPATDISAGDTVGFFTTANNGRWPITQRVVTSVSGTTIGVATPMPYAIPATATVRKIPQSGIFSILNGTIDLAQVTDPVGGEVLGFMNIGGYQTVLLQGLTVVNYYVSPTSTDYFAAVNYARAFTFQDSSLINLIGERGIYTATGCAYVSDYNLNWDGDGFGVAAVNADSVSHFNLRAYGRYATAGSMSIRGIRDIGCLDVTVNDAIIVGYDSAVKFEDCGNIIVSDFQTRNCNIGINASNANLSAEWSRTIVNNAILLDCATYGVVDVDVTNRSKYYTNIIIERPGDIGMNLAGEDLHLVNITVRDWASAKYPITVSQVSGTEPTGNMSNIYAYTTTTAGRLGLLVSATATNFLIDDATVYCNIAWAARPIAKYFPEILLGSTTLNLNVTTDQSIALTFPGYTRYRISTILVVCNSGNASACVGGIYTAASKAGTQVVANTQAYTSLTTSNTNQIPTLVTAGVAQVMTTTPLYFALTTAAGGASTGAVYVYGYLVP